MPPSAVGTARYAPRFGSKPAASAKPRASALRLSRIPGQLALVTNQMGMAVSRPDSANAWCMRASYRFRSRPAKGPL